MSKTRDNFGTFAPAERPPSEILLEPFGDPASIGKIYCQQCGQIFEFGPEHLAPLVTISNCFSEETFDAHHFDGRKHFFLAKGCMACAEKPIFVICEI